MKCTPHSESRRQLMRDYLLAEAWHTPHHNLQLVQFTVMCWVDLPLPFPRLPHKHRTNVLKIYHIALDTILQKVSDQYKLAQIAIT